MNLQMTELCRLEIIKNKVKYGDGRCENCRELRGTLFCGTCREARYCSKTCQQDSWRLHKLFCKPHTLSCEWKPCPTWLNLAASIKASSGMNPQTERLTYQIKMKNNILTTIPTLISLGTIPLTDWFDYQNERKNNVMTAVPALIADLTSLIIEYSLPMLLYRLNSDGDAEFIGDCFDCVVRSRGVDLSLHGWGESTAEGWSKEESVNRIDTTYEFPKLSFNTVEDMFRILDDNLRLSRSNRYEGSQGYGVLKGPHTKESADVKLHSAICTRNSPYVNPFQSIRCDQGRCADAGIRSNIFSTYDSESEVVIATKMTYPHDTLAIRLSKNHHFRILIEILRIISVMMISGMKPSSQLLMSTTTDRAVPPSDMLIDSQ